jgi:hypothetical protein
MEVAFLDVDFQSHFGGAARGRAADCRRTSTGVWRPLGASDRQAKADSSLTLTQPSPAHGPKQINRAVFRMQRSWWPTPVSAGSNPDILDAAPSFGGCPLAAGGQVTAP